MFSTDVEMFFHYDDRGSHEANSHNEDHELAAELTQREFDALERSPMPSSFDVDRTARLAITNDRIASYHLAHGVDRQPGAASELERKELAGDIRADVATVQDEMRAGNSKMLQVALFSLRSNISSAINLEARLPKGQLEQAKTQAFAASFGSSSPRKSQ